MARAAPRRAAGALALTLAAALAVRAAAQTDVEGILTSQLTSELSQSPCVRLLKLGGDAGCAPPSADVVSG